MANKNVEYFDSVCTSDSGPLSHVTRLEALVHDSNVKCGSFYWRGTLCASWFNDA